MKFNLPKLYHGLVRRRCLQAIHEKTGAYIGGLSPDIFASLSIACVAQRVMVTDYPLTIPGAFIFVLWSAQSIAEYIANPLITLFIFILCFVISLIGAIYGLRIGESLKKAGKLR